MELGLTTFLHVAARPMRPDHERSPQSSVLVTLAHTQADLRAAAQLLESRYASRGYRASGLDASPAADRILIAALEGETIGTLTLRFDSPAGLRADDSYAVELDAARAQGRGVCELSQFAVARSGHSIAVLAALFGHAYECVRARREVTDVFIEVNPRHVPFYRNAFGFRVAAGERTCPRVLAPSVLLRLEVATFGTRANAAGGRTTDLWMNRVLARSPAPLRTR